MHFNIGMPRLLQRLNKRAGETRKFIGNYIYYRKQRHSHTMAWKMAKDTL